MASTLDSEAAFASRAKEVGLEQAVITLLKNGGVNTYGSLAFITAYRPGQSDEQPFVTSLETVLRRAPTNPELILLRRLFFEACTLAISDLKQKTERDDTAEPVRMAIAERNPRLADQKARLVGVHFSLESEPSHKLVDTICQMGADQSLQWLPWEQLTSRASEITHSEKDWKISFDSQGALKVAQKQAAPEASTNGEFKVRAALNRRARAFDLASVCSYVCMEEWHERLFELLSKDTPANAMPISMQQIREADKALFKRMADATRGTLTQRPDGTRPMEAALTAAMSHPEVQFCLIPMVRTSRPNESNTSSTPKQQKGKGKGLNLKNDWKKGQAAANPGAGLPPGCSHMTPEGKPVCNGYNRGKCQFAKDGKRCRRGFHVCWKCFKPRPYTTYNHS